jgi:hypothetical protein
MKRVGSVFFIAALVLVFIGAAYYDVTTTNPGRLLDQLEDASRNAPAYRFDYVPPQSGSDAYWPAILLHRHIEKQLGASVTYDPLDPGYLGLTWHEKNKIQISKRLDWNARFEVLAHEGAHLLQPQGLYPSEAEVFAESVGFLVLHSHGRARLGATAQYLSLHKASIHVMRTHRREILWVHQTLMGPQ